MSYSLLFSADFGAAQTGLTLRAQLYNADGTTNGAEIAAGFNEPLPGFYAYTATIPDGHRGSFGMYKSGDTTIRVGFAVNPQEFETAASGSGDTVANHDTGGADNLRFTTAGGTGIDNADINAYVTAEYDADPQTATVRGQARTRSDGRWAANMLLNTGVDYTFVFTAVGYAPATMEATV